MTDYTAGGLVTPIDWTRQHEPPTEDDPATHGGRAGLHVAASRSIDGEFELVGDPANAVPAAGTATTATGPSPTPTNFE